MIQIYSPTNTNFDMNGDVVLFPETCETMSKLNGEWYMDIEHPLDEDGRWRHIAEEAVIAAPTFMGDKQLFRIDDVEKNDDGVKAKAYPVFFDSADELFVYSCKPTFANGQKALNMLTSGSKYSGESNITKMNSAEFINRNLMDCINGDDPAFIKYWGGDVLYDNYKVIINTRAGSDRGFQIRYRKNMDGVSRKVDMSSVVTRIVPVAYNGRMMTSKYVDSPNIGKYAKVYTRLMEFPNVKLQEDASEEEEEGITVCTTQAALNTTLTNLCKEQFNSGIDLPKVTLNVDMIDLSDSEEYKEFADLEKVSLGDTVGVYHRDIDIDTEERCIEIKWDCIKNRPSKLTLGDYEYDYLIDGNKEALDKWKENYQNALAAWREKFNQQEDQFTQVSESVSKLEEDTDQFETYVTEELDAIREEMQGDLAVTSLSIGGTLMNDCVIEERTSGIWTYRKWKSGIAELWGQYGVTNVACNIGLEGMYRTDTIDVGSYPFTFKTRPYFNVSFGASGTGAFVWPVSNGTTTDPPSFYLFRPDNGTNISGNINLYVKGTLA